MVMQLESVLKKEI